MLWTFLLLELASELWMKLLTHRPSKSPAVQRIPPAAWQARAMSARLVPCPWLHYRSGNSCPSWQSRGSSNWPRRLCHHCAPGVHILAWCHWQAVWRRHTLSLASPSSHSLHFDSQWQIAWRVPQDAPKWAKCWLSVTHDWLDCQILAWIHTTIISKLKL